MADDAISATWRGQASFRKDGNVSGLDFRRLSPHGLPAQDIAY
jgi:hypothetical protein